VGASSISMYRYQTLSVFANASFPACVTTSVSLVYTWSLFQGSTLQYSITSYAKDQRFYRLAAYKLTSSTSYLLRVSVSAASSPSVSLTTAQVTLNVGASGVSASITGGATQSFGVGSTMALDASGSQDIDYPGSALSYKWSCMEISPNFGNDCKNFSTTIRNSSTLSVSSNLLAQKVSQTQLSVTVYVTNSKGYSASASMTAIIQNSLIPVVSIRAAKTIFNVGDAVAVTGLLSSTVPMRTVWTVSDTSVSLSAISSNSKLNRTFTAVGFNAFDLGITANSLVAGLSYTFQLSAQYLGFSASSYAQITITMNTPPSGGSISVAPSVGTALTTAYFMSTTNWVDDASDYPFSYIFSYYTTTSTSSVVVKNLDTKSYSSSVLGQGLQGNNYLVTCVAVVMDVNNGSSSVLTTVMVKPGNVTGSQTAASLATALSNLNPSAVAQIIGATTSSVNAANCSVSVPCWKLHRENCSFTALTCGPCLSGYIGVSGSSNVACFSEDSPPATATCTAANAASVCESGKCNSGVCVEADKTCTSNCSYAVSGNGQCTFYDVNNAVTSSCAQSNSFCRAACVCNDGFYGSDCSLDQTQLESVQTIRDALCVGLYQTLSIQDVSADVINSRATSIANILLDVSQVGEHGFTNCTAALIETIQTDPELAGSGATATLCMEALSSVLQKGSDLSAALVANISSTLAVLNNGIQSSMAVGQQAVELTTANVRMSSALQTASDIGSESFGPPQTAYEKYLKQNTTAIGLDTSASSISSSTSIGVAVMQYVSSPHGIMTASKSTGLQVSAFATTSATSRRRLDSSASLGVSIELQNIESEYYYVEPAYNSSVYCERTYYPYNTTAHCKLANLTIACSGFYRGYVNFTCPSVSREPKCRVWDGTDYSVSPTCSVVSYTNTTSTCACTESVPGARRLSSSSGELNEFSTSADMVVGSFVDTVLSAGKLSPGSVTHNPVIFSICVALFVLTFGGLVYLVKVDVTEMANQTTGHKKRVHHFQNWSMAVKPVELTDARWYSKLWNRLKTDHDFVCVLASYSPGGDFRAVKWVQLMGMLINFLFVDTILAVLFFYDDGSCEAHVQESQCLQQKSLDQENTLCIWYEDRGLCGFNHNIGGTFYSTLILTGIITCASIPFQLMFMTLVRYARDFFCIKFAHLRPVDTTVQQFAMDIDNYQTFQCTVFRAARLVKMQQSMDNVSAEEEASLLQKVIQLDIKHNTHLNKVVELATAVPIEDDRGEHENETILDKIKELAAHKYVSHHFPREVALQKLVRRIRKARNKADELVDSLSTLDPPLQNKELLQQFLVSTLSGYRKAIAERYFELPVKDSSHRKKVNFFHYLALVILPIYMAGACFYIFLFAVRMGSRSTSYWLQGGLVSLLEDIILLKPMKLYLKWIGMSVVIQSDIGTLLDLLFSKFKLIMLRSSGLMRGANSLIQHMNPACRAARKFPGLPMSRLLMSLSDIDLPRDLAHKRHAAAGVLEIISVGLLMLLSGLPNEIEDTVYDSLATAGTGAFLILMSYLARFSILLPIFICVGFVGFPLVYYFFQWVRSSTKLADYGETALDEILDMEMEHDDPIMKKQLTKRQKNHKHVRKIASILPMKGPSVRGDFTRAFSFMVSGKGPRSPGGVSNASSTPSGASLPSMSPAPWMRLGKRANDTEFSNLYLEQPDTDGHGKSLAPSMSSDLSSQISRYFQPASGNFSPIAVRRANRHFSAQEGIDALKDVDDDMDYVHTSDNEQGVIDVVRIDSANAFSMFDEIYKATPDRERIQYSTNEQQNALRTMQSGQKPARPSRFASSQNIDQVYSSPRGSSESAGGSTAEGQAHSLNRSTSRFLGVNPLSAHKSPLKVPPRAPTYGTPGAATDGTPSSSSFSMPATPRRLAPIVGRNPLRPSVHRQSPLEHEVTTESEPAPAAEHSGTTGPSRPKTITEVFGQEQGFNPLKRNSLAPRGMRVPALVQDYENRAAVAQQNQQQSGYKSPPGASTGLAGRLALTRARMPPPPSSEPPPIEVSASLDSGHAAMTRRPTVRQLMANKDGSAQDKVGEEGAHGLLARSQATVTGADEKESSPAPNKSPGNEMSPLRKMPSLGGRRPAPISVVGSSMHTSSVDTTTAGHHLPHSLSSTATPTVDTDRLARLRAKLLPSNPSSFASDPRDSSSAQTPDSSSGSLESLKVQRTPPAASSSSPRGLGRPAARAPASSSSSAAVDAAGDDNGGSNANASSAANRRRPSLHTMARMGQEARNNAARGGAGRGQNTLSSSRVRPSNAPSRQPQMTPDDANDDDMDATSFIDTE
jgi:hypothetical protein